MAEDPVEITSLIGREVYSSDGVYVGEVDELNLDLEETDTVRHLALTDLNPEVFGVGPAGQRGVLLPYRWVRGVGDVIIVSSVVERLTSEEEDSEVPDSEEDQSGESR